MTDLWQKKSIAIASEVLVSIAGIPGVVALTAFFRSLQNAEVAFVAAFLEYFAGGQLSLSILYVSGIVFLALLQYWPKNTFWYQLFTVVFHIFLFFSIIFAAISIGTNPGFQPGDLSESVLGALWILFASLYVLWIVILIVKPKVPGVNETGEAQQERVRKIKFRAASRAQ